MAVPYLAQWIRVSSGASQVLVHVTLCVNNTPKLLHIGWQHWSWPVQYCMIQMTAGPCSRAAWNSVYDLLLPLCKCNKCDESWT